MTVAPRSARAPQLQTYRPLRAVALAILAAGAIPVLGCSPRPAAGPPVVRQPTPSELSKQRNVRGPQYPRNLDGTRPLTHAERTSFTETSSLAHVVQFVDSLKLLGAQITSGVIGKSAGGLDIPYIIASRPLVSSAAEGRRSGKPIVYVQANIHGGEVEGKEAVLALLRDMIFEQRQNILDSLVLIVVPVYNPDGNERLGPQERNRANQNGPALVGRRANADSLDLNRDYIKAEAPETRASLAMIRRWDPDLFLDLHTTNGSYHGYALTYSPPLNPASLITGPVTRDSLLPEVRRRMRADYRTETFDYGNFLSQDSVQLGWYTYDHRPRFGTNYMGLRGRLAILSEAYSHDPFARRIGATYQFVWEVLSMVAEFRTGVMELTASAERQAMGWGTQGVSPPLALQSQIAPPSRREAVRVEVVERTGTDERTQPGLPPGLRRTGRIETPTIPIFDRFVPTLTRALPFGYAFSGEQAQALLPTLALHGVIVERLEASTALATERFRIDSVHRAQRPFQGHHEVRLAGEWSAGTDTLPAGTYLVRTGQPLAVLAFYLLEPQSDDGLVTWNRLDPWLRPGARYPLLRVMQPVLAPLTPVADR